MPLSALHKYGLDLIRRGKMPPFGWASVPVAYCIILSDSGELIEIRDVRNEVTRKDKTVKIMPNFHVPYRDKHTSGTSPFFLCDNAIYLLGQGEPAEYNAAGTRVKGDDPVKVADKFNATKQLHLELLGSIQTTKAQAICNFFRNWNPDSDGLRDEVQAVMPDLRSVTNIIFGFEDGSFAQEDPDMMDAWNTYYAKNTAGDDVTYGTCLVTGKQNQPIARTHPPVSGIKGAQSAGAYLVSFGTNVTLSSANFYGKRQGDNAPVSIEAAETYGGALRYLFKSQKHHKILSDGTHLLFWAEHEDEDETVAEAYSMASFGRQPSLYDSEADEALYHAISAMTNTSQTAELFHDLSMSLSTNFYVLGVRPHAARLAVVSFEQKTLGTMFENVMRHNSDLAMLKVNKENKTLRVYYPNLFDILANMEELSDKKNKTSFAFPPSLQDGLLSAIHNGTKYPPQIEYHLMQRIRRDGFLTDARMAMMKAYLLRNGKDEGYKEAATMALNHESNNPAYLLGQLFWEYEKLQREAIGESINRTIKDQYFSTAITQPEKVFPIIMAKGATHLAKLLRMKGDPKFGRGRAIDKRIQNLTARLEFPLKANMNRSKEAQMAFTLGYFHAKEYHYRPAELKDGPEQVRKNEFDDEIKEEA